MQVIAAYVYKDGCRNREVSLNGQDPITLDSGEYAWIGLVEPSAPELNALKERFDLHPLAVEDALHSHQMPKVEIYGDKLFLVTRTAQLIDEEIHYGETEIFVGKDHIITVRHGSQRTHVTLRSQLESSPGLLKHGVDYVLHAILDYIVDGYQPVLQDIEDEVLEMERRALDSFLTRQEVNRLFHLRRDLIRLKRMMTPMKEMTKRLEHLDLPFLDKEIRPYFRDVYDHCQRVEDHVDTLREIITWVFEASSLLEQQRQNAITRKLAAWAAILAVPTAIAGIYGMNFKYMPELEWKWGYYGIMLLIGGVCALLYARLKKIDWL